MVKRTSFEHDDCPIARSLDAIGDWWSMLIIREALFGVSRFGEFQKKLGLAKNILTVRLRALVDQGILKTAPASDGSAYQEYLLTPKGRGVFPILVALRQWSEEFDERPEEIATILVDKEKGRPVRKLELYSQDGRLLTCGRYRAEAAAGGQAAQRRARLRALTKPARLTTACACSAVRSRSSASSCAMPSRWPSTSSRWRSASLTSSATVSAMKATASSGPPSSPRHVHRLAMSDFCLKLCASGRPQPCSKNLHPIAYNIAQK